MSIDAERRSLVLVLLEEMSRDAEEKGINNEYARRFVRAGEDALAVREFFFIADSNAGYREKWGRELEKLNDAYSAVDFYRSRMGYPLSWSSDRKA